MTDIERQFDISTLPAWITWLAQDADGTWWAYEAEPHQHHQGWYENEIGRSLRLVKTEPNPDWRMSLRKHQAAGR